MKEDFLHYVWSHKKFDFLNLKTVCNKDISIIDTGSHTQNSGADFFNAQLILDNLHWAGNVEIHLKSSDWYVHNHHLDKNYDNVILHVVWDYDVDIYRRDYSEIPVLQLRDYIDKDANNLYMDLHKKKNWIYCENQLPTVDKKIISNWKNELFKERLEQKVSVISALLAENKNNWEATLFCMFSKNFGLNSNGTTFLQIARSLPFTLIRKEAVELENIEALFFGRAGLLEVDFQENYPKNLKERWDYLRVKYRLEDTFIDRLEFFKHRPDNFPTIRLAQLAMLYHHHSYLFDKIIKTDSLEEIYTLFKVEVATYWKTHYVFEKESSHKHKRLSKDFIDLLIINTIVPLKFAYAHYQNKPADIQLLVKLLKAIKPEKNIIIDKYKTLGVEATTAFDTQSLLQLKKNYCDNKKCLDCAIGTLILK